MQAATANPAADSIKNFSSFPRFPSKKIHTDIKISKDIKLRTNRPNVMLSSVILLVKGISLNPPPCLYLSLSTFVVSPDGETNTT